MSRLRIKRRITSSDIVKIIHEEFGMIDDDGKPLVTGVINKKINDKRLHEHAINIAERIKEKING